MATTNLQDALDYLTEEDIQILGRINFIKKNFLSLIDRDEIILIIKKYIKEAKYFSFLNNRSEKFISTSLPTFNLKFDRKAIEKDFNLKLNEEPPSNNTVHTREKDYRIISDILRNEITSKVLTDFSDMISKNETIVKYLDDVNINKEILDLAADLSVFLGTIFQCTIFFDRDQVTLEYSG